MSWISAICRLLLALLHVPDPVGLVMRKIPPSSHSSRVPLLRKCIPRESACGAVLFAPVRTIDVNWLPLAAVASPRTTSPTKLGPPPVDPPTKTRLGLVGWAAREKWRMLGLRLGV